MYQPLEDQLKKSRMIRRPMEADPKGGAFPRWAAKPVKKVRDMEIQKQFPFLHNNGPGTLHLDLAHSHSGKGSIRLDTPTSTGVKKPTNRAYAQPGFFYPLEGEDLREYNRLSFWTYVDSPGFASNFVIISFHNEGEKIMPAPGRFDGFHHADVVPGQWTQVIWEFPDIYRDKATGFNFYTLIHGSLMNASEEMSIYIDDFKLEVVEPEKTKGWDLNRDSIAYCHSGYLAEAKKEALVQNLREDSFSLADAGGKTVFSGKAEALDQGFKKLDFSEFKTPGFYTIQAGPLSSGFFAIGNDAYLGAAWKTLNFFFAERCGFEVPGLHIECHLDTYSQHPDGRTLPIHGGWHDAADLSQAIDKTCDIIVAMLDLGDATKESEPELSERVLEEARWGLNWAMRTRFGDGYRHTHLTKSLWTKNFRGDKDDMTGEALKTAIHNYTASYTCAYGAKFYEWDKMFYDWCIKCAIEDFYFGEETLESSTDNSLMSERIALGCAAAAMLYRVTGEERFLKAAAHRARQLSQCQQLERRQDFSIPLHGYFFEDRKKTRPISFYHRSYEHFFMEGFILLLTDAPQHEEAPLWRQCVDAYRDFITETAHVMAPYDILPSGVYEIDNTEFANLSHEGNRAIGSPTLEEYNRQLHQGIKLSETHFLRRFPVCYQFRGFHTTLLSKAKNVFILAEYYKDRSLYDLAVRQLEYTLGMNPFAYSTMYGEGYDYPPLYGGLAGMPVGSVPVGFQTFEDEDEPYMPMQNNCTYKEIWVCSTARLMWSIAKTYRGIHG
ncbi:MAG: glycoside hydrolase family 9 protein [Treponema sp.]|nr:glycoside hydrolase family 9 protein [Treponema sp.]